MGVSSIAVDLFGRARGSWLALIVACGCSFGATPDPTTTLGGLGDSPSTEGSSGTDDVMTDGEDSGPGDDTTGPPSMTTGDVDASSTGPPPSSDCTNTTSCPAAEAIGGVSGDQVASSLDATGVEPTWLTFEVSEDNNSVSAVPVSFTATLHSPPGADFDLVVYRGVEGGSSGCGGLMQQSLDAGSIDMVSMSWGEEGLFANNDDDSAWVAVEILAKDDICAPPQEWQLIVEGNTL